MARGRLYGRDRWHPGRILSQIGLMQALFYAMLAGGTGLGCLLCGLSWPVFIMFSGDYYDGQSRRSFSAALA
jgi:hypothetical protein